MPLINFKMFYNRCSYCWFKNNIYKILFCIKFDAKLYVPVFTLSTQDKIYINSVKICNKYEPKVTVGKQNRYLDFVINPSHKRVNRL